MLLTNEFEIISILLMGDYDDMIIPQLELEYFNEKDFSIIFKACQQLFYKKHIIEPATISDILNKNDLLSNSIGEKINKCIDNYITGVNYQYYINQLIEDYKKRIVSTIKTPEDFKIVEDKIKSIATTSKIVNISYKANELLENYYNDSIKRIKTGYKQIDDSLGCLMSGDYVLIAGATGSGKTWTMLNFMLRMAKQGNKIAVFSLEMSLQQIQNRFACLDLDLDSSKYRKFNFEKSEVHSYDDYVEKIMPNYEIDVVCEYDITIDKIKNIVRKGNYDIIFIDYLGLISGKGNSYEKFSEISRGLKQIALEDNICIACLHQLNRNFSDRQDKRPKLSDIRDSGKIEQDIDACLFIHKPYYYDPSENSENAEIIIAKNRHGASNKILNYKIDPISQKMKEY